MIKQNQACYGLIVLLIISTIYPASATSYPVINSCHCVAFRLDDIQDYWLNNVQTAIIDTFQEKNASLTIGIIGNYFGNDTDLVTHIKEKMKNNSSQIEIANHGWNHEDFTQFSREQQSILMKNTNDKISNVLGVTPSVFIPPFDAINSDTMAAFLENNFQYISANTTQDTPSSFIKNMAVYHLPETAVTGDLNDDDTYWYSENYKQTFVEITDSLKKHGYSVVMMHPFEYSIRYKMNMENKVDLNQIHQLELLIDKIRHSGLKIVTISDIPKHTSNQVMPTWTSNLFTWYDKNQISEDEAYAAFNYLLVKKIVYL
jgi:peptidoglycan/xylan/chitin deacetylase (PgdA/CDA1 family)